MRSFFRYAPCVLVMGAIFYFSSRTGDELGALMPWFNVLFPAMESFDWGHFAAYFVLGLSFVWAIGEDKPSWKRMFLVVLLCLIYGLTDEYHQTFVAGRTADWRDIRNDGIGAALAMLALRVPVIARLYARLPHGLKRKGKPAFPSSGGNKY